MELDKYRNDLMLVKAKDLQSAFNVVCKVDSDTDELRQETVNDINTSL